MCLTSPLELEASGPLATINKYFLSDVPPVALSNVLKIFIDELLFNSINRGRSLLLLFIGCRMNDMGIHIGLLIGSVVLVTSADLRRPGSLPLGTLWLASTTMYGGLGVLLPYNSDEQANSSQLVQLLSQNTLIISIIGFALGYCAVKRLLMHYGLREINFSLSPADNKVFGTYVLFLQAFVAIYFAFSILLDLPDRYNTYPSSTLFGKLFNSISLVSLLGPAAYFYLARQIRANRKYTLSRFVNPSILLAALNLFFTLKTGSRSLLLGLILSFVIGWVIAHPSKRTVIQTGVFLIILTILFIPVGEALRIARSDSDFYRANPRYANSLLTSSLKTPLDFRQISKQLVRHPLDRSVYGLVATCQQRLSTTDTSTQSVDKYYIRYEGPCNEKTKAHIGTKYWPSLQIILRDLSQGSSRALFPSGPYLSTLETNLHGKPNDTPNTEAPSLRADVFYRFGTGGVFLTFLFLGALYGGFNSVLAYLFVGANLFGMMTVALLPLTLLTGNLSLTLLSQIWLFTIQLPKNMVIIYVAGCSAGLLATRITRQQSNI